eukprot:6307228-Prymnesium_polylepis.2
MQVINRVSIVGSHWAAEAIGTVADTLIPSKVAASTGTALTVLDNAAVPRVQCRVPAAPNLLTAWSTAGARSRDMCVLAIAVRCTDGAACGPRAARCGRWAGLAGPLICGGSTCRLGSGGTATMTIFHFDCTARACSDA